MVPGRNDIHPYFAKSLDSFRYGAFTGSHIVIGDEQNVSIVTTEETSVVSVVKDGHDKHPLSWKVREMQLHLHLSSLL